MMNPIFFIVICFLAGGIGSMLQGMIGIGTGVVMVPLLAFLLPSVGIPQSQAMHVALATTLLAISINSISALKSHYRHGNIRWEIVKKIILFSMIGSSFGAYIASQLSSMVLQVTFGVFLLGLSIYLFLKKSASDAQMDEATFKNPSLNTMAVGGICIGFVSSWVGSGGGVLMVPFLHRLHLKMRYAVGTSTLLSLPVALVGAFTYVLVPAGTVLIHWPALLAIATAGTIGAPIGVHLSTRFDSRVLIRIFAGLLVIVAVKMIANSWIMLH
jgi:uncharacterized membrane protein YfcA